MRSRVPQGPSDQEPTAFVDETSRDDPAVGLVATPENSDDIPAAILRARQHGHRVLVTARCPDCEGLEFARALGAVVVSPPGNPAVSDDPRERLVAVARVKGFPGLIFQDDPAERIDFAASTADLATEDAFDVDARLEPSVDRSPRVLVGIPAYNEATTIADVVETALQYADEVLVVDDGSDDDTATRAEAAGASVLSHEENSGYGATLKTLFRQADRSGADQLVVIDGDGQHDPADIPDLVATQRETGSAVVIGSRFGDGTDTDMPLYRRFGLAVVNLLTNLSLGVLRPSSRIRDTQSGFRAYDRHAIESLAAADTISNRMNASTDILYHARSRNYDIKEVPTTIDYTVDTGSSLNPVQHGIMLVMNIIRTVERKRPITMLGLPGVVSVLLGFGFSYWTITNYVRSGTFSLGLALTASVFIIVGMFAAFTSIILHSLALHGD